MTKDQLKKQFGEDFKRIFSEIEPLWMQDDNFKELFKKLGICALEYSNSYYLLGKKSGNLTEKVIENNNYIDEIVLEIIKSINDEKGAAKKIPTFALFPEISARFNQYLRTSLEGLKKGLKIKEFDTINNFGYEIEK